MEHAVLCLMPSDPSYLEMDWLQCMICWACNPSLTNIDWQMEHWQFAASVEGLKQAQGKLMDELNFNKFKERYIAPSPDCSL